METKKRNPLIAFLLSVIAPGLGQVYNTQLKKGIAFYFISIAVSAVLLSSGLPTSLKGLVIFLAISLCIYLYIIGDSLFVATKTKEAKLRPYNKWYFYIAIFVLMLGISNLAEYLIANTTVDIKSYKIPSAAMLPTVLIGDHVIVDLNSYKTESPERGDIIVFKFPRDHSREFIKRIVAVEGDIIELRDKKLFLNGVPIDEPYVQHTDSQVWPAKQGPRDNFGPLTVPDGKYFVMGDNRDVSEDSRFWGFVSAEEIRGKVFYIYWSWDYYEKKVRFNRVGNPIN